MISCCGQSGAYSAQQSLTGTSSDSGGISLFGSANCGLCMKCLLFWILAGVLILILIRGRD